MTAQTAERTEEIIARECLAVRLRMLNRVVTNIYDRVLRPMGVRASQLNILVGVALVGDARPADMCRRLRLDSSTLSRNVERMKAKGWLEVIDDLDGRAQPLRLTQRGREVLERAKPAWEQAQRSARKLLGDDAAATIDMSVQRIRS